MTRAKFTTELHQTIIFNVRQSADCLFSKNHLFCPTNSLWRRSHRSQPVSTHKFKRKLNFHVMFMVHPKYDLLHPSRPPAARYQTSRDWLGQPQLSLHSSTACMLFNCTSEKLIFESHISFININYAESTLSLNDVPHCYIFMKCEMFVSTQTMQLNCWTTSAQFKAQAESVTSHRTCNATSSSSLITWCVRISTKLSSRSSGVY